MPEGAFKVHGLSAEFLADKPVFASIAAEFIEFIADSKLVAHNASFDMGFLNHELGRLGHARIDEARVVDTLNLARRKHPFGPNSLDALCQRYGIDNTRRIKHGALLDAEILADVYLELLGGRQTVLGLMTEPSPDTGGVESIETTEIRTRPQSLPERLTLADIKAHKAFFTTLKKPVWADYNRHQDKEVD
jgi:DNA polymerase-3 subunit epsilon